MKIYDFIIPKNLETNEFVQSLYNQFTTKGKLSERQLWALEDMLDIDIDFFEWEATCELEGFEQDFDKLMSKMKRNRFRKVKTRNKCIRAIHSIINKEPKVGLIADALGENFQYRYRRYF